MFFKSTDWALLENGTKEGYLQKLQFQFLYHNFPTGVWKISFKSTEWVLLDECDNGDLEKIQFHILKYNFPTGVRNIYFKFKK